MTVKALILPIGLTPGPRSMIMDKPRELPPLVDAQGDYIQFNKPKTYLQDRSTIEATKARLIAKYGDPAKRGCAKLPNKKKNKKGNDNRVRTWLIMTTSASVRNKDTAMSAALQTACINRMLKKGLDAGAVMRPIVEREKRSDASATSSSLDTSLSPAISKETSWKLYKDGWFLDANGVFMRTGPIRHEDGHVHFLRLGKSAKSTPSYMSKLEQRRYDAFIKGEVHCG